MNKLNVIKCGRSVRGGEDKTDSVSMSQRPPVVLRANGAPRAAVGGATAIVDKRVQEGKDAEDFLWRLCFGEGWMIGSGEAKEGIAVFSRDGSRDRSPETSPPPTQKAATIESENEKESPKSYRIWKCQGEVHAGAEEVFKLMCDTDNMPNWNKDVTDYRILETIDPQTDIAQCVSAPSGSGTVSARDFVIIRRRSQRENGNTFLISDTGTKHQKATNFTDGSIVRGWNGPGGIIIKKISDDKCWVCWVLNKDLRGWLPRSLVDQVIAGVLVDWLKNLRKALTHNKPQQQNHTKPQQQNHTAAQRGSSKAATCPPEPTPIPCPN